MSKKILFFMCSIVNNNIYIARDNILNSQNNKINILRVNPFSVKLKNKNSTYNKIIMVGGIIIVGNILNYYIVSSKSTQLTEISAIMEDPNINNTETLASAIMEDPNNIEKRPIVKTKQKAITPGDKKKVKPISYIKKTISPQKKTKPIDTQLIPDSIIQPIKIDTDRLLTGCLKEIYDNFLLRYKKRPFLLAEYSPCNLDQLLANEIFQKMCDKSGGTFNDLRKNIKIIIIEFFCGVNFIFDIFTYNILNPKKTFFTKNNNEKSLLFKKSVITFRQECLEKIKKFDSTLFSSDKQSKYTNSFVGSEDVEIFLIHCYKFLCQERGIDLIINVS